MRKNFTTLLVFISLFLLFNPFTQKECFSQIPTESFHNIEFAFEEGVLNNRLDLGIEYGYQFGFANYFSVYPYARLNFFGFEPMANSVGSLAWVNNWAGKDTVGLNIALLGIPYIVAGAVVLFQSQYLFDYGVDFAYHPFLTEYFDSSVSIGLENSSLKYYRELNGTSEGLFFYPFLKTKIELNGKYKLGMISAWAEYQFDIFHACELNLDHDHIDCSDFNIGLGISLILGRN